MKKSIFNIFNLNNLVYIWYIFMICSVFWIRAAVNSRTVCQLLAPTIAVIFLSNKLRFNIFNIVSILLITMMVKFPFGYHKINQTMFNLLSISATFISISIFYLLRDILFPNLYLDNHQKEMIYIASSCMFIQILDNYLSAFIFSIFGKLSYFYLLDTFQNRVFMTTTTLLVFIFVRYIFNSYSNHIENTLLTK